MLVQILYFLIYLPRQLFFFEFIKAWKFHIVSLLSFPFCNENLNSFLTRWGNYSRRGNYSREETIWGDMVSEFFWKKLKVFNIYHQLMCHSNPHFLYFLLWFENLRETVTQLSLQFFFIVSIFQKNILVLLKVFTIKLEIPKV